MVVTGWQDRDATVVNRVTASEVTDAAATTRDLVDAGATLVAAPTETPWRSLNARLEAPAGLQITVFEELESLEVRTRRESFGPDVSRDH